MGGSEAALLTITVCHAGAPALTVDVVQVVLIGRRARLADGAAAAPVHRRLHAGAAESFHGSSCFCQRGISTVLMRRCLTVLTCSGCSARERCTTLRRTRSWCLPAHSMSKPCTLSSSCTCSIRTALGTDTIPGIAQSTSRSRRASGMKPGRAGTAKYPGSPRWSPPLKEAAAA